MMDLLREHARRAADPLLSPYSRAPVGVAVADDAGRWLAAPRVESASYPLSIPALQGVWALASIHGLRPAAVALSRPATGEERAFVQATWPWLDPSDGAFGAVRVPPHPSALDLTEAGAADDVARAAARRAVVPASDFRVGAALRDTSGRLVFGANVEHPSDWTRGLCAERVALVAGLASGLAAIESVTVVCESAPGGSPCGGCRQLLAEYAPDAEVRIWTGQEPLVTSPSALLPGAFVGSSLGGTR